jgi:anthranilate phosphoribosyltransferase
MMTEQDQSSEHPFAQYIRTLGKGKNGQRSLTQEEAHEAMTQICCYDVEPEQLGAFLMLMRVKEETPAEVAGFAQALRESIALPEDLPSVAIDWPSYAGKRRHLPWYLLAALLLGRNGYPVFMHGLCRKDERLYTEQALKAIGIDVAQSLTSAVDQLRANGFAYLDIENLSALTGELLETRDLLGLRSPIHTVARMINPLSAELSLAPVFHPNYAEIHQEAASLLGQPKILAFRGEGGEAERIPDRDCMVYGLGDDALWQQQWPALMSPGKYGRERFPDLDHFVAVYEERVEDPYATSAVVGTMALCIQALEEGCSQKQALSRATMLWEARVELTKTAQYA